MILFFQNIEPITYYIALTLYLALYKLYSKNKNYTVLIAILSVAFITEIASAIIFDYIGLIYTISMIINSCLWLHYILHDNINKMYRKIIMSIFVILGLINMLAFEGLKNCNFKTFILGSIFYLLLFIYISFRNLKKENFSFFFSNKYILLSSPILFFTGLSFVFAFKSTPLARVKIFSNIELYDVIIYFVNFIMYTLINIYIYRERKLQDAR